MVNGTAGWGDDRSVAHQEVRSYRHPWSRTKSIVLLVGMVLVSALLVFGGVQLVNLALGWV